MRLPFRHPAGTARNLPYRVNFVDIRMRKTRTTFLAPYQIVDHF